MKLFAKLTLISTALIGTSAFAVDVETRSLEELYQAAVKEGGTLVVYAGGDPNLRLGFKIPTQFILWSIL